MQGLVEIIRCVHCLKDGKWPSRIQDVVEVDVEKLKEQMHVKDEDIARLDAFVTTGKGATNEKEVWFGLSIMAMVVIAFSDDAGPGADDQWPPGTFDAGADRRRDHAWLSHRIYADGFRDDVHLSAYYSVNPALAVQHTLDLMVQRAYAVMSNDVLISVPLFVFMGYLVERANLIERLFKSLHLATTRIPGSLAVATVVTCAIFATASGIIGAV